MLSELLAQSSLVGVETEAVCHQPTGELKEAIRRNRVVLTLLAVRIFIAAADILELAMLLVPVHQGTTAFMKAMDACAKRILAQSPRTGLPELRIGAIREHLLQPVPPLGLHQRLEAGRGHHVFPGLVVDELQLLVPLGIDR